MRCDYQPTDNGFVCKYCGDRRGRIVHRNCPANDSPPLPVRATKLCIRCDAFPCLGPNDCKHEKAIRAGEDCPQAKWFWC